MVVARRRTIPKPSKARYRQSDAWKGHDGYFTGPIPRVDHGKALRETGWLTKVCLQMWEKKAVIIDPQDVIRILNRAGVKFVLMGAHVNNAWTRVERATRDVDMLVQRSHHRKAVQAIERAYPGLSPKDTPVVTRFIDPADDKAAIDLMKPVDAIHKAAMRNTIRVGASHNVPDLEMAMACKFAAMVSPNREINRKRQDAVDFSLLVTHNKKDIKRKRLRDFGELVFAGAGKEILKLLDDIIAGRPMIL